MKRSRLDNINELSKRREESHINLPSLKDRRLIRAIMHSINCKPRIKVTHSGRRVSFKFYMCSGVSMTSLVQIDIICEGLKNKVIWNCKYWLECTDLLEHLDRTSDFTEIILNS